MEAEGREKGERGREKGDEGREKGERYPPFHPLICKSNITPREIIDGDFQYRVSNEYLNSI